MIRAVISDFGGVLTTPLAGSFQAWADESGIGLAAMGQAFAAIAERGGANPLHELECGRMTEEAFVAGLQRALSDVSGREVELGAFAETLWARLLPNEPMIALMASLRAEGYRMALLTNNVREWEARWRAMAPIDDIFELVVDSAFVGMRKPEPAIYELATARLGVPADECLFVDDREDNCAGVRGGQVRARSHHWAPCRSQQCMRGDVVSLSTSTSPLDRDVRRRVHGRRAGGAPAVGVAR